MIDINGITGICNSQLNDNEKSDLILKLISLSNESFDIIFELVKHRRDADMREMSDLNLLLSKLDCIVETPKLMDKSAVRKEIDDHYSKSRLMHCFREVPNEQ